MKVRLTRWSNFGWVLRQLLHQPPTVPFSATILYNSQPLWRGTCFSLTPQEHVSSPTQNKRQKTFFVLSSVLYEEDVTDPTVSAERYWEFQNKRHSVLVFYIWVWKQQFTSGFCLYSKDPDYHHVCTDHLVHLIKHVFTDEVQSVCVCL